MTPDRAREVTPADRIAAHNLAGYAYWGQAVATLLAGEEDDHPYVQAFARHRESAAEEARVAERERPTFQERVAPWMQTCFGAEISADMLERCDRFTEEGLELVQSLGYSSDRAHALVGYVFDRPIGEPSQEVGGAMVTLAALCLAAGLDMHVNGETELARINQPEIITKIRTKQAAKPTGSALPIATAIRKPLP